MLTLNSYLLTSPWHPQISSSSSRNPSKPKSNSPHNTSVLVSNSSSTIPENNNPSKQQSQAGRIKRLVLNPEGRAKLNPISDREFYAYPRLVTHVDDRFISTLTDLYRERLRPGSEILDLMSSWVSHLPEEVEFKRVVGHGLNAQELAKNRRLDYFFVKDLNQDQKLELESCSLDAVVCTVSVQYLQQPEQVFAEIFRVLRPGGVFIVSFSNRMFYEKAIAAWRDWTAYSRVQLVVQYFQCIEGFTQPETVRKLPSTSGGGKEDKSPLNWIMRLLGLFSGACYEKTKYAEKKESHTDLRGSAKQPTSTELQRFH